MKYVTKSIESKIRKLGYIGQCPTYSEVWNWLDKKQECSINIVSCDNGYWFAYFTIGDLEYNDTEIDYGTSPLMAVENAIKFIFDNDLLNDK